LGEVRLPRQLVSHNSTMRQAIGAIRRNEQTRGFLLDVMRETVNVGRARGVTLAKDYADMRVEFCDVLPAEMTASIYQDLVPGNRLELPRLTGSVLELVEQMGISVSRNRAAADILALTKRQRPQLGMNRGRVVVRKPAFLTALCA
jgi:2-dehydropantoate 2-reductase